MAHISPAMQVRLGINAPAEFDIRKSHIKIHFELQTGRYVKTVLLQSEYPDNDFRNKPYSIACRNQAALLWREKYCSELPNENDLEVSWAETLFADSIPYDGKAVLSADELDVVSRAIDFGDFTLDMLWLIVDCLGWRPGKVVREDDPGWISIWAEEEECGGYLAIVRDVLGMPEVSQGWVPPAVQELVNSTALGKRDGSIPY